MDEISRGADSTWAAAAAGPRRNLQDVAPDRPKASSKDVQGEETAASPDGLQRPLEPSREAELRLNA